MRGVRIPQDLNGEDQFILGLSVPRLAALLLGLLAAYTLLHLSIPRAIQLPAAAVAAGFGALIAWVRPEGRSLIHWAIAAIEYKFGSELERFDRFMPDQSPAVPSAGIAPPSVQPITAPPPRLQVVSSDRERGISVAREVGVAETDDGVIDLLDSPQLVDPQSKSASDDHPGPVPVYLGGPQVITFFSTKGGTGRTTLATEVATLLATRGHYRESPSAASERLRVALIDFDLASANVSARLGLAQPTMLDYLCDTSLQTPHPREFVVRHAASNLDVLLGPSKCLAGDRAELMGVAQAARILSSFKTAGYHFLILDMAASLGDLETYLLEAATRIYCVVTPTAGAVQSLYRGVEALRRLGLGQKLHYVANKMRAGVNLSEAMGDLKGSLVTSVPYDRLFDDAENRHRPLTLQAQAPAMTSLMELAASIYPALPVPSRREAASPVFGWFSKRRRAG